MTFAFLDDWCCRGGNELALGLLLADGIVRYTELAAIAASWAWEYSDSLSPLARIAALVAVRPCAGPRRVAQSVDAIRLRAGL